jgi:hypothetical protein
MKLAPAIDHIQARVRLTIYVHTSSLPALISFLNASHSNFLNAFFMRPY